MRLAACAAAALILPAAAIPPPGGIAPRLAAPADETPAFALRAQGVHIFECKPLAGAEGRFAWSFTVPEATLYDAGRPVARSTSGNHFEALGDRSAVAGVIRSQQAAGANDLPWLLMRAQPTLDAGLFAGVTSIQRVNTTGGAAPLEGCNDANVGKEARVPFEADYYFYRRAG